MQQRHQDRRLYFRELANTSREFYLDQVREAMTLTSETRVLEIGCGEGGNLLPFAELGCCVTGIDIDEGKIKNAELFFGEAGKQGTFIASDFMKVQLPETEEEKYDLLLLHDVIEHIEPPYKEQFLTHMMCFMKSDALVFIGFPAWQMPFGGHQQICKGKLSKMPYIHLLPKKMYKGLLTHAKESEGCIDEMLSIKRAKMPIEKFEKLVKSVGLKVEKRRLWLINPHYKQKFGLRPVKEVWPFTSLVWLRNFYTTSAWYLVKKR